MWWETSLGTSGIASCRAGHWPEGMAWGSHHRPHSPDSPNKGTSPKSALLVTGQAAGRGGVGAQHPGLGHGADAHCLPGPGELPSQHFPGV